MIRILALSVAMFAQCSPAAELIFTPDCPTPAQDVTVTAYQAVPPPAFLDGTQVVTRSGNTFSFVVRASDIVLGGGPPSSVSAPLGPLPAGNYHVDFYVYHVDGFGNRTQQLLAQADFSVSESAPACTPSSLHVVGSSFNETMVGTEFADALEVQVLDDDGRPVPNLSVNFSAFGPAEESAAPPPSIAGVTLSAQSAVTDTSGIAKIVARANSIAGVSEVVSQVTRAGVAKTAYFVLANRSTATGGVEPIVEFYNQQLDHYFITSNEQEMSLLDTGQLVGWQRTGAAFLALPAANNVAGASQVCRFYGLPSAGLDSHFFTASSVECAEVEQRFAGSWILETPDAFDIAVPDTATGICPVGTVPVYRVYDNRPDANHRYSTSTLIIQNMLDQAWIAEGYGPQAVVMCSPT